jgi:hypothetical protein
MTKGIASQSLSKTCLSGQTKVRLNPTGGEGVIAAPPNPTKLQDCTYVGVINTEDTSIFMHVF